MSELYFPFDSVDSDRVYRSKDFREYFAQFIGNGVFYNVSTSLKVQAYDAMEIQVYAGSAWIDGAGYILDDALTLRVDNADGTLDRIDRVVLRCDYVARLIQVDILKGTPSAQPVAPSLTRNAERYELGLADVRVNHGSATVSQSAITDLRLNKNLCGIVTGLIDQVDTTEIFEQLEAYQREFEARYIADFNNWSAQERTAFDNWFATIRDILDSSTAGKLQNEIDALSDRIDNLKTGGSNILVRFPNGYAGKSALLTTDDGYYSSAIDSNNIAIFNGILEIGNISVSSEDTTASMSIQYYSWYELEAKEGSSIGYQGWLNSAGITASYPSLDAVLSDERVVRELFTKHTSCDYFMDWYAEDNSMLDSFTSNRIAMKWIGLRDYVCDKLFAIEEVKTKLKASAYADYVFNGDENTYSITSSAQKGRQDQKSLEVDVRGVNKISVHYTSNYTAVESICYAQILANGVQIKKYWNQYDIEDTVDVSAYDTITLFSNSGAHESTAITNTISVGVKSDKRKTEPLVPIMTSATAPLGEYIVESGHDISGREGWHLFGNFSSGTYYGASGQSWLGYKSPKPLCVKSIRVKGNAGFDAKFQGSNDGITWEDLVPTSGKGDVTSSDPNAFYVVSGAEVTVTFNSNNKAYKQYRILNILPRFGDGTIFFYIQFYGASYSEEEFGTDGIEMLYDNGVEIAENKVLASSGNSATKEDDYVLLTKNDTTIVPENFVFMVNKVDVQCTHGIVEAKEIERAMCGLLCGDWLTSYSSILQATSKGTSNLNIENGLSTNDVAMDRAKLSLNISSVSPTYALGCGSGYSNFTGSAKVTKIYAYK